MAVTFNQCYAAHSAPIIVVILTSVGAATVLLADHYLPLIRWGGGCSGAAFPNHTSF